MSTRVVGVSLVALFASCAVQAADLPSRRVPPVMPPLTPAPFSWSGFYIGANAGYGFGGALGAGPDLSVSDGLGGTTAVTSTSGTPLLAQAGGRRDGFVGGGQIGYNIQPVPGHGLVFGLEADFQYSGLGAGHQDGGLNGGIGSAAQTPAAFVGPADNGFGIAPNGAGLATTNGNVAFFNAARRGPGDFLGTARGRIGYAFDRVLVFATGGLAYADGRGSGTRGFADGASVPAAFYTGFAAQAAGATVTPTYGGSSGWRTGYAVGGGIEYALATDSFVNVVHASAVSLKVEGLYVNLGRQGPSGTQIVGVSNTGAPITGIFSRHDDDFAIVRAGINFKFGSPVAPVVARY